MRLTFADISRSVAGIANRDSYTSDVLYELLAAYGRSKSAITQLREGVNDRAEDENSVLQKDVVYFRAIKDGSPLEIAVQQLAEDPLTERYGPRYLIATDLTNIAAKDTIKGTTLSIKLADIDNNIDFFWGWTGDEIETEKEQVAADRRAAEKLNELYHEIEKENRPQFATNPNFHHELNIFFTRLLFCFFAEDTKIFSDNQFSGAIKQYTQTDGSDLDWFFDQLFTALDTENKSTGFTTPFADFPYVNGSIFDTHQHAIGIPKFNAQARHLLLQCGGQDWGNINPDIFGTIFEGVVDPSRRGENGMDYTSVPNIHKVIDPLFMDGLREQFDKVYDNEKKLWALLVRIQKIKIFDPACGSGNFLIISYKELRLLQHAIIVRIGELRPTGLNQAQIPDNQLINIDNFYGIEIDDFARELAVLSLVIAKHQMNQMFYDQFHKPLDTIPLHDIPTIRHDNATRIDWQDVCPNVPHKLGSAEQLQMGLEIDDLAPAEQQELLAKYVYDEIYLIGNPPYKGSKKQTSLQKADFKAYFGNEDYSKNLDYISIWFIKGARYIAGSMAELAFVSTNSICQGEHVGLMFPKIYDERVEVGFAHTSFKWQNSAKDNSGVIVIVLSLRSLSREQKYIYTDGIKREAANINGYLLDAPSVIIKRVSTNISCLPNMVFGSMPRDGGGLILTPEDKEQIPNDFLEYIHRLIGADEFLNGKIRYCLWIEDDKLTQARSSEGIRDRLEAVTESRHKSKAKSTRAYANRPNQFVQRSFESRPFLFIPRDSSGRREYIPLGMMEEGDVTIAPNFSIYGAELWLFSILHSKMHMLWVDTVSGKLKNDYRYSSDLAYNNFPILPLTSDEKAALTRSARCILFARENHPEKTLADMYDPDKMPTDLRVAHDENDQLVDHLYSRSGFRDDEARLEALFALYKQMTKTGQQ